MSLTRVGKDDYNTKIYLSCHADCTAAARRCPLMPRGRAGGGRCLGVSGPACTNELCLCGRRCRHIPLSHTHSPNSAPGRPASSDITDRKRRTEARRRASATIAFAVEVDDAEWNQYKPIQEALRRPTMRTPGALFLSPPTSDPTRDRCPPTALSSVGTLVASSVKPPHSSWRHSPNIIPLFPHLPCMVRRYHLFKVSKARVAELNKLNGKPSGEEPLASTGRPTATAREAPEGPRQAEGLRADGAGERYTPRNAAGVNRRYTEAVAAIKNQGQWQLWAFSATEAIESQLILGAGGKLAIDLAPQRVVVHAVHGHVRLHGLQRRLHRGRV